MTQAHIDKDGVLWVDGKKILTLIDNVWKDSISTGKALLDETVYLGILFEKEKPNPRTFKEVAVVPRRFKSYETTEAIYSIFEDLRLRGYKDKVFNLRPENFELVG